MPNLYIIGAPDRDQEVVVVARSSAQARVLARRVFREGELETTLIASSTDEDWVSQPRIARAGRENGVQVPAAVDAMIDAARQVVRKLEETASSDPCGGAWVKGARAALDAVEAVSEERA